MSSKILLRRGTAAQWTSANPTLGVGELGIETDTLKIKVGNGSSTWTQLTNYINVTPSGLSNSLGDYILLANQGNAGGPAELDSNGDLLIPENSAIFWNDPAYSYTTTLTTTQPTANRVITFPNATGTVALTSDITSAVTNLINAAPSTLDTLNELAAAINNDSSFSTTVNNLLSGKVSKSGGDTITAATASTVGLVIKSAASQTANLLEFKDSSGTVVGKYNSSYQMTVGSLQATVGDVQARYGIYGGGTGYLGALSIVSWAANVPTAVLRGYASQTANLTEWQNSAGTVLAKVDASGIGTFAQASFAGGAATIDGGGGAALGAIYTGSLKGSPTAYNFFSNVTGSPYATVVVKQLSGQTTNLQEWQASSGTLLSYITSSGSVRAPYLSDINGNGSFIQMNSNGAVLVNTRSTTNIGLVVYGQPSQTADLQQWWDSSSNVLTKVDSSGAIYLINPTANNNANDTPSPAINFQGNIWNSAYGNQNIKGAIKVAAYTGNTNPTISKMSFLLATDNGTPAEVASFTNTGAFSNIGGLDAYGSSVIFRLRNTTAPANSDTFTPSPKLELMGRGWNSNQGASPSRAYLQVNVNNTNSDPFINRLGVFVATGNNAGGYNYGADATEYMSILGNGTVGINTATPLGTLDIRPISASNKGIVIKGAASQTANLQEWQNSSGTVTARFTKDGEFSVTDAYVAYFSGASNYSATLNVQAAQPNYSGIVIRGKASQTANLQQWQNSSGTVLSSFSSNGRLAINTTEDAGGRALYVVQPNGGYGSVFAGVGTIPNVTIYAASGGVGLLVQGAASQTANLQEWQNSSGTALARIKSNGNLIINADGFSAVENTTSAVKINSNTAQNADEEVLLRFHRSGVSSTTYGGGVDFKVSQWQSTSAGAGYVPYTQLTIALKSGATDNESANINVLTLRDNSTIGINNTTPSAQLDINIGSSSRKGLIVKAAASQTANLQEWQSSDGTIKSYIASDGSFSSSIDATINSLTIGRGGGNQISNVAIGLAALLSNTTGVGNTQIGLSSGQNITTGSYNVGVGNYTNLSLTTGISNTSIGTSAGSTITTGSNITVLGYDAEPSSPTISNEITLGNANVTKLRIPGIGVDWTSSALNIGSNRVLTTQDEKNIYITDSGTARTLGSSDAYKILEFTSSSSITVTIPNDASDTTFPIGSYVEVRQMGGGQITVSATSPATLVATDNQYKTRVQYSAIVLEKRASNAWYLAGDTTA